MNKIYLKTSLFINGVEVKELTYDANQITALQFSVACAASADVDKTKAFALKMRENDYSLHMYLGFMAIIAVNPHIDIKDLERIKGLDILQIANVGFFFIYREIGGSLRRKHLRRAIREYSRYFHTSITEVENKPLIEFLIDYREAVEEVQEQQRQQKRNAYRPPRKRG